MSTQLIGRIGGQYMIELAGDERYKVSGKLYQEHKVTLWTGEYDKATKLLDYCVLHDGEAQTAMQELYVNGDPTLMGELLLHAQESTEARTRRRIGLTVDIETDVLEGENSLAIATARLAAACQVAGMRVGLIQSSYCDWTDSDRRRDLGRIAAERDFLLDHFIETDDGMFTFPDGHSYPAKKKGSPPQYVHGTVADRRAPIPTEELFARDLLDDAFIGPADRNAKEEG